ncbi:MOSC domain-containing protein [Deinococcus yavapaiensis]|uniref:MOSC domain-containing protein YiiM n=1 Tax=Deinococcus yavapaiensis KR-236 TaxID=694435 RepID=A0A318S401_9DEIO|nr:MOSC domain-containing protein [Deinococcus yavapaiensis]PYE53139.1 MOSC domain-containing protein YiiM [Deinococcus yavapaiensis KR-236]
MHLTCVNVAQPREHEISGKPAVTGIFKVPQVGSVFVGTLGLAGDFVGDTKHHGGPDQAVYVYSTADYDVWSERLGEALAPGTFGENLTFTTFGEGEVRIGDRYKIGDVVLEVTCPRIPCDTLAARMNDLAFVKKFREVGRPGFYARVLSEGRVEAGMPIEKAHSTDFPTIGEAFELWFQKAPDLSEVRRMLSAPIAERGRKDWEEYLAQKA